MRAPWLLALALAGCGASLLPTTVRHVRLEGRAPSDADFAALAGPGASLVARAESEPGEWLAWSRDASGAGVLTRITLTPLGLEAQSIGTHEGPAFRPSIRRLTLSAGRGTQVLVVVESSASERSVDRTAWLYVEARGHLVPVVHEGATLTITLHRDEVRPLDAEWERERTVSAALRTEGATLLVEEHATERERARGRGGAAPRAVREVDRVRRVTLAGAVAGIDRPSLLDAP